MPASNGCNRLCRIAKSYAADERQDFYVNFGDNSAESEGVYRSWDDEPR